MAAYISIQKALARILMSLFFAAVAGLLVWFAMRGPRLGSYYDLLLGFSESAPLSAEILLIESRSRESRSLSPGSAETLPRAAGNGISGDAAGADIIEPALAASVLMTLAEFNASALVIQTPILGAAFPLGFQASAGSLWEEGILVRLNDEFALVNRNIGNFFDAIRTGSVAPAEAEQFMGELINLTDRGKERLLTALIRGNAGGIGSLEQAAAVFGNVWIPGDLRLSVLGAGGREPFLTPDPALPVLFGPPERRYFRPLPDRDGRVRRIAPVIDPGEARVEHVVYSALKNRIRRSEANYEPGGQTGAEFPLPLDSRSNVLFIPPGAGQAFRRLSLEDFRKYEEADQELYRILKEAEALDLFREMDGESYPPYRYEYAQDIRGELLENPVPEHRARWIEERARYFQSLDEFFAGSGKANFIVGYDELIIREGLKEEGRRQVITMREDLIRIFQELWEKYTVFLDLRSGLEVSLAGSFCILGSPAVETGSLETSALLANSFLTGKAVHPASDRDIFLALILSSLLVLCILAPAGPWLTLGAGLALTAGVLGGFSYFFVRSAFWLDPLIPGAAVLAGTLSSFVFALAAKNRAAYRFRIAYGPHIAPVYLKRLIKAYYPLPTETVSAKAAIVAIRDQELKSLESRSSPGESAAAALAFRREVLNIFGQEGGVMVGAEGDLVMIALGSPLERTAIRNTKTRVPYDDAPQLSRRTPAAKAVAIVRDIAGHIPQAANWRFALDTGDCAFSCSGVAGYAAYGRPVACARLFSGLAARYKVRVLVTSRIIERNPELRTRKLGEMVEGGGEIREGFYEALFTDNN
jgi:class 3 adenylate cyclase